MASGRLDQLLRQLKPAWKNIEWAKKTGLNPTHLSRIRKGRVGLSANVAQRLAATAAPNEVERQEELLGQFLAAGSESEDKTSLAGQFPALMSRLSHPGAWVCVEYRDLPRASEGGKYQDYGAAVGRALKAGACFAMFQPFAAQETDADRAQHYPPAVRSYISAMIGEVRGAYAKLALAAEKEGMSEREIRQRLVLYEREDGSGLSMGFQSRLFCAQSQGKYGPAYEVWEWIAALGDDLFVRRDIDSKAVSQQFFEVVAYIEMLSQEGKTPHLPSNAAELSQGRAHAKRLWPDLQPKPIWKVSRVCSSPSASSAGSALRAGRAGK